ncbi:hypothetical protein GCM10010435_32320 [Winogradskya consettensis]|uniref:Ion transport domain-containing protein n=1 Tax=Winogradskya consettensis TaxID=113560 RepID=A0A919SEK5_9ACTN|nr:ion transporter [Actinoplanes consettensis]GIM70229.1 hypothetical protein Aco04nite_19170 [Actinoplanes consettensis]
MSYVVSRRCAAVVDAAWFNLAGFAVIVVNALLLGLETYDGVVGAAGPVLQLMERFCIALFAVELLVRFGAQLATPGRFFRDGWNLFDLAIVVAPLLPGVRENVTILRLLRLARILRTFRLFPSLRVILVGIRKALPGLGSFVLITVLVIYGYAMLGWMMFADAYPERYGTVGQAMLTLFLLLSLDGITDALEAGREVSDWAVLYYVSYMVAACYLLTNLLVGLVLTALQEAHEAERSGMKVARDAERSGPKGAHGGERFGPGVGHEGERFGSEVGHEGERLGSGVGYESARLGSDGARGSGRIGSGGQFGFGGGQTDSRLGAGIVREVDRAGLSGADPAIAAPGVGVPAVAALPVRHHIAELRASLDALEQRLGQDEVESERI